LAKRAGVAPGTETTSDHPAGPAAGSGAVAEGWTASAGDTTAKPEIESAASSDIRTARISPDRQWGHASR
jgi:hypothetical protein